MNLAIYGDAFVLEKLDQLPEEILEHVAECLECEVEIIEVLEIIKKEEGRLSFPYSPPPPPSLRIRLIILGKPRMILNMELDWR
jgi:hypothetical protein